MYKKVLGVKVATPGHNGYVDIHQHFNVTYRVLNGTLSVFMPVDNDEEDATLVRCYGNWLWMEPIVKFEYE